MYYLLISLDLQFVVVRDYYKNISLVLSFFYPIVLEKKPLFYIAYWPSNLYYVFYNTCPIIQSASV